VADPLCLSLPADHHVLRDRRLRGEPLHRRRVDHADHGRARLRPAQVRIRPRAARARPRHRADLRAEPAPVADHVERPLFHLLPAPERADAARRLGRAAAVVGAVAGVETPGLARKARRGGGRRGGLILRDPVFPSPPAWTRLVLINANEGRVTPAKASARAGRPANPPETLAPGGHLTMAQKFTLGVNGKEHSVEADPDMPLLYALRNDLGLNNPHFGCGLAQCGACTVHLDGQPTRACVTPMPAVGTAKITTLSGLGTPEKPHPLQKAYVEEEDPQCGYCINGWIMTAAAFLRDKKKPSDAEIKEALSGLKCRCGTHMAILRAVKRASVMMG